MKTGILVILMIALLGIAGCENFKKNKKLPETQTQATEVKTDEPQANELQTDNTVNTTKTTIEDTIKYQIGGELFYLELNPKDSITVIRAEYYTNPDGANYREYHFVIHNTNTSHHKEFTPKGLDTIYRDFKDLSHYEGYWIYLDYQPRLKDYFIESYMGVLSSFKIKDKYVDYMMMDGVYPQKITSFKENDEGFTIKTNNINEYRFNLIDSKREIYSMSEEGENERFYTPALNWNKFGVSVSVNNTGDLI